MRLVPGDDYTLDVPCSKAELRARFAKATGEKRWLTQGSRGGELFIGKIEDEGFELRPAIFYRNSFVPLIRGRFEPSGAGTRLAVTQRLHPFVQIFMIVWLSGVGFGVFVVLVSALANDMRLAPMALIPLAMFAFGMALPHFGYRMEGRASRDKVERVARGESV